MTATTAPSRPELLPSPPERALPVALLLGVAEGRRLVLHPVALLGLVLLVGIALAQSDNGPRAAFDLASSAATWFYGVPVYFAANLVASRDRRARSGELLAALPSPPGTRVSGLCLAALAPTAVSVVVVATLHALYSGLELYAQAPSVWHLAQGPLTVLGAALLGTMVARLAPVPGAALLVMIAMVLTDAWLTQQLTLQPLSTYVSWPVWDRGEGWNGLQPGHAGWHAGYLASLCGMAAAGAFLRDSTHRARVLGVGALFTVCAAMTGVAQLP